MRAVYQIDDPTGAHVNGRVLIAPNAEVMVRMLADFQTEIAPCVAVEVASEADLVIPPPPEIEIPLEDLA